MNEKKEPFIEQQDPRQSLYAGLQEQTLETVQRLSGRVWTDFNPHDPGVTLGEAANYALTELDYKLGFPLVDYLAEPGVPFDFGRFGLFPASEVLAPSVVTVEDYRRLFLENIPGIINLQMEFDAATGGYGISFVKMPFYDDAQVAKKIESLYQKHRNLCEWLERLEPAETEALYFEADIDICPGEDATTVLARVYGCILAYLSGESALQNGKTEYDLYKRLCQVEGVKYFRTCFLKKDGVPQSRFPDNATIAIPTTRGDLQKINLYCGNTEQDVNVDLFVERLRGFCLRRRPWAGSGPEPRNTLAGKSHDIYSHYSIANDLPACYHVALKDENSSFGAYVSLYDSVIAGGLAEAKALPELLSIAEADAPFGYTGRTLRLKNEYLDFLDQLYGVESQPSWLREDSCYGETPEEIAGRRMAFLRNVPMLQRDRAKGRNLGIADGKHNSPAVKVWFCLLLGLNPDDVHLVCNVLPKNNLRLFEVGDALADELRIDSFLIDEAMLAAENVQDVERVPLSRDVRGMELEFDEMRAALPFFHGNLLSGDLFRNGTNLKNYKIVRVVGGEYMLLFRHREYTGWTNLGHGLDVRRLVRLANILRRYLRELNRACETMYLLEPVLADPSRAYEVAVVLPAWTFRFHKPRFREECCKLLRSLLPAHLGGKVCWISESGMRKFEFYYQQLICALADPQLARYRKPLLEAIDGVLAHADEIQDLDDAN